MNYNGSRIRFTTRAEWAPAGIVVGEIRVKIERRMGKKGKRKGGGGIRVQSRLGEDWEDGEEEAGT
jgi:hypothetical protein